MAKQNYAKIREWQGENTDRIQILARKSEHLPERIQQAINAGKAKSRQAYIIGAVNAALDADGFPAPEPENDKAQPGE